MAHVIKLDKDGKITNTEEIDIKLCPFCKSRSVKLLSRNVGQYSSTKHRIHYGYCNKCRAKGPQSESMIEAINMWNGAI